MNMELAYSEARRDAIENQLTAAANKIELMDRSADGLTVILYWLRDKNICTVYLEDKRADGSVEFVVPNDKALDNFHHPFANPDANLPIYERLTNYYE
jgi:hypothetical protein